MSKEQFSLLPNWKQLNDKKSIGLFKLILAVVLLGAIFVCIAKLKNVHLSYINFIINNCYAHFNCNIHKLVDTFLMFS